MLYKERTLTKLERSIITQEAENENQMFALHSVISHLSRCDPNPVSLDLRDVITTSICLMAKFPTVVAYNYKVSRFRQGGSLKIIPPDPNLSMAENFLYMLRGTKPHKEEAMLFDLSLMLHAEHGGGNNSTFTVRAVSSSGANTYMSICSGIASLSGHLHGGANEAVMRMMKDVKKHVKNWEDRNQVKKYLTKILDGKAHDGAGKIYGLGHAVYTESDPRAIILLEKAEQLASDKKDLLRELELMKLVAEIGSDLLRERKGQVVAPNVDYYSGSSTRCSTSPSTCLRPSLPCPGWPDGPRTGSSRSYSPSSSGRPMSARWQRIIRIFRWERENKETAAELYIGLALYRGR